MTSITIKFTYCGEIRKKSFAQIPSFALIEREFQTYYGDRLPLHKKIEYQDQEGDIITIANEEDLQEALTGLTTVDSVPVLKLNITPLDQNTDMVQLENQTNIIVQNAGDAMMTDADEPVTLFWQIPKEGGFVYKRRIQPPPKLTCSAEVMNSISGVESVVVDIFMKIQDDWNNVTNSGILEERKQPSIDIKEKTFSFKDLHLQKLPSHFHQPKYSAFFLQFSINLHNGQTYNCKSAEFYIVSKPAQLHSGDVRFDISKVVPNSAPHNEKKQIVVLGDGFRPSPSWRVTFGDIEVQGTPWGQGALECFSPIVPSPITVPVNVRNKSGATQKNNLLFEFHGSVSMAEESLTLVTEPSFSDIGMQNDIFPLSSGLANNNYGWGDLHMLSGTSEFGQMLKLVNEEKQDVNQVDYELATPLWWSIYEQNYEMAEILLIKCGANPDLSDQNGVSPLHIAASSGALKMVTKLVEYGSNVNAETKYKETALHFAAGQGHPEIAQFLIQKGANFVSDNENESPLDWAKLEEQYNVIPLLTKLIKEKQKQKEMLEKQKLKSQQQKNGSKDYSIGTRSGTHTLNAKLVLLGESAVNLFKNKEHIKSLNLDFESVGKSSIVLRFVKGQFLEYQESTIGAAFLSQTVGLSDGNIIKYEIWDTAGQERYHSLAPMYYRGASCAIIVYDITCYESFQKAKSWVAELNRNGAVDIVIALLGNKLDLEHRRTVPNIEALNYCEENGLIFLETSAKTGSNINDVFVNIAQKLPARERIFGAKTEQRILSAQSNISHKEAGCCLII